MLKRLLSAAAVLALLANPISIWAQAGACIHLCLQSCNKQMMAAHNHAANTPNFAPHTTSARATSKPSETHHCNGMQQASTETNVTMPVASTSARTHQPAQLCHASLAHPSHKQGPVAPCCQSTHNTHVMDAGVSPALLIALLPEHFVLAQLNAVRQRVPLGSPAHAFFVSSPPFEPPRS